MSGMEHVPMGPPWSVDLIADLHAGVLPPEVAAQLRPRVESDPAAMEILRALDATLEDLHALPPIPMPDHVAARIDAALAAEARPGIAPVVSLNDARKRRNRRLGLGGAGVLVAAAAAFGIVLAVSPGSQPPSNDAAPAPTTKPGEAPPLSLKRDELGSAVGDVLKAQNYGPLETPDRLAGCLKGGGINGASKPLGISPINLEGKDAVMAILPGGVAGQIRLVVLDPKTCGPDKPEGVLENELIAPR